MHNHTLGCLAAAALLLVAAEALRADAPAIVPLGAPAQWEKAEFRLDGLPTAANNFDPDEIAVDATIVAPSGATSLVPAFWYQQYALAPGGPPQSLTAVGGPGWRLRFTPSEAGRHELTLAWRVGAGGPCGRARCGVSQGCPR